MRSFTPEQLAEILAKHQLWLNYKDGGEKADLRYANLRYADLSYADLSYADLSSADLSSANLSSANLSSADLRYANLRYADLRYANLSSANLSSANLRYANLRYADLSYADLSSADLSSADLRFIHSADGSVLACINAGKYQVVAASDRIAIGYQMHSVEDWMNFDDDRISRMDSCALEWWNQWKELVFEFHKNIFGETK